MYIPQGVVHCFFFGGDFLPLSAERGGLFVDALGFLCLRSWFLASVTLPPSVPQTPLAFPSIPPPPPPPPRHPCQQSHRNPSKPNTMSGIGASVRFEEVGWNGRLGLDGRGGGNGSGED